MHAEKVAMLGKNTLDTLGRKNIGKRKPFCREKHIGDFPKIEAVPLRRIWYVCSHRKTLLGLFGESSQGGQSIYSQGRALQPGQSSAWRILKKTPRHAKLNPRAS
ncbi:hypothetical protein D6783_03060 [Candidatus Woesearchaeota archaeon]|nr:MAG: hypothetical protein D6783_03060 [Candidatus Woesearchaeota archaeon]